jgi:dolichyl-phosphate-mannose-protein mannosyltransferase
MIFLFSLAAQLSRWASRFTNRIRAMNSARLKLLVFLASAAALSSLWAIIPDRFFFSTSWDYDNAYKPLADTILNGHPFIWMGTPAFVKDPSQTFSFPPGTPVLRFPPGYPLLIAATLAAAEKLNLPEPAAIDILNLVATAICAVCLFSIAAAVFGRIPALLAPLLWITYPPLLLTTKGPASEIPFCALLFAAIDLAWIALNSRRRQAAGFFGAGLLLGCAMLVRAQGIGLGLVLAGVIWVLLRELPARVRLSCAALLLLGNLLAILPWEAWAYRQTGRIVVLATEGSASFCDGLTFAVNPARPDRQAVELPANLEELSLDFLAKCRHTASIGERMAFVATELWQRPLAGAEFIALKATRSWYATNRGLMDHYILLLQMPYGVLLMWASVVALRRPGRARRLALIAWSVGAYSWALTTMLLSLLRYMVPAMGLLFVLCPAAIAGEQVENCGDAIACGPVRYRRTNRH